VATLESDDQIAAATVGELKPYAIKVVLEEYNWPTCSAAHRSSRSPLTPSRHRTRTSHRFRYTNTCMSRRVRS